MSPGLAIALFLVGFAALGAAVLGLTALVGWWGLFVGIPVAGVASYYLVDALMTKAIEG